VSRPDRLIQWAATLLKPTGKIILLNHFRSTQPIVGWFEKVLNPLFVKIGWRSDLALEEVLRETDLQEAYRFKVRLVDLWQIVVLTHPRNPASTPAAFAAPPAAAVPSLFPAARLAVDGTH
jgi:phosphatidylethanolamine/phosphatidyl-N-methylethanolamine N-methyltransferase